MKLLIPPTKYSKQCDELLSALVDKIVGFGYPQSEELKLGVQSKLAIDDQLKTKHGCLISLIPARKAFRKHTMD